MTDASPYHRAALLVDFDNIVSSLRRSDPAAARIFATDPLRWAGWLEERLGAVGPVASEETSRVLLQKICYLNPSEHGNFRAYFTRAGFRVVDCPSLTSQGKNSADIHMVIDALDLLAHSCRYDEFIILSLDADFSPLFHRLRSHDRRVVMLGSGPSAAALRNACDYVIPDEVFISEALFGDEGEATEPDVEVAPAGSTASDLDSTVTSMVVASASDVPAVEDIIGQREAVRETLRTILAGVDVPVHLAKAAHELTKTMGPAVRDSRWLGAGTFKALVRQLVDGHLDIRIRGVVGFVYDPSRHDISAAFAASPIAGGGTEDFSGSWADVAGRIVRVLGLPALQPEQWASLFSALADELNSHPSESMSGHEQAAAAASGLARTRVHFVTVGLTMRSYPFNDSTGHSAAGVAECFLDNTLRLAENAQLVLDDVEKQSLREWLTGALQ